MPWVKIDENFPDHPKVARAGPMASWLYVCGLAYCNRLLTDGFIPAGQVRKLADVDDAEVLAERLVAAELWEEAPGGYRVHDYLEYQPSKEHAATVSEARAAAGQVGGKQRASNLQERRLADASSKPVAKFKPVPGPVTVPDSVTDTEAEAPPRVPAREEQPYGLWLAYCEEVGAAPDEQAPAFRSRQLGVARRLLDQGYGEGKVRPFLRFLKSQDWRSEPVDLITVEKGIGKWEANGMPALASPRASPNGRSTQRFDELRDFAAQGLEPTNDRNGLASGHDEVVHDVAYTVRDKE